MIRLPRLVSAQAAQRRKHTAAAPLTARSRALWTVGNACMLFGVVVLLYVGGLYANDEYGRYAARGDTDVPAPVAVAAPEGAEAEPAPFVVPAPFVAPVLNNGTPSGAERPVSEVAVEPRGLVSRLVIPSVALDAKVVEVGWEMQELAGQQVPVWQVAKYAVGQHYGSANPGQGENIVLAGHVGGYGQVFRDLFYVHPGDEVVLYSGGQEFRYTVQERLVVDEEGAPAEQRAANASLIGPSGKEVVTMVTCWPATGPDKFKQRVIVRAVPFSALAIDPAQSSWTIR